MIRGRYWAPYLRTTCPAPPVARSRSYQVGRGVAMQATNNKHSHIQCHTTATNGATTGTSTLVWERLSRLVLTAFSFSFKFRESILCFFVFISPFLHSMVVWYCSSWCGKFYLGVSVENFMLQSMCGGDPRRPSTTSRMGFSVEK